MRTVFLKNFRIFIVLFALSSAVVSAADFAHLDPDHIVPRNLLREALRYYVLHPWKIHNKRFLGIIDFRQHNSKERFHIIDMQSGRVDSYLVAHGKNSDPDGDGFATYFSNTPDSNMSSLGLYRTAETFYGDNGYSLRIDGLSETNSNVRERAIVIHPAKYVSSEGEVGYSLGCPAIDFRYHQQVIDQIKDGALIYAGF